MAFKIVKILVFTISGIVGILLLYLCFFLFGGPICNDIKAAYIERELVSHELPKHTEIIESDAKCLNSSGTGNHIEIMVGIIISSELPKEEIRNFYYKYEYCFELSDMRVNNYPFSSFKFESLNKKTDFQGRYLVVKFYDAFTQSDIRGH